MSVPLYAICTTLYNGALRALPSNPTPPPATTDTFQLSCGENDDVVQNCGDVSVTLGLIELVGVSELLSVLLGVAENVGVPLGVERNVGDKLSVIVGDGVPDTEKTKLGVDEKVAAAIG